MIFRQFVDDDLGCASYLIGDEQTGEAVVVDPAYAVEQYREEASRRGVRIVRVLETHTHADHVSGHGRLALEDGVPVAVHPAAEPEYPHEPLADGDEISVGEISIRVLHTPGHRPEHCCFTVTDRGRSDEPWLVLTGDSLLIGDAARPDLAIAAREGSEDLFESLQRLLELQDGVEVYPGHVAGSLCGVGMSSKASSTIGFERRANRALAVTDVAEFVARATAAATPRPPNMQRIVDLNRGPFVGAPRPLRPVSSANGATILDARPASEFVAGHIAGAINVPLDGSSFPTRAGFVLDPDRPTVLYASSREQAERAARGLRAVGFLDLAGVLTSDDVSARVSPVALDELEALVSAGGAEVIDVREKDERDAGYIPGSRHIPYRRILECTDELRGDTPVVVICETGARASIAASLLAADGIPARPVLDGGVGTWKARGNRTTQFRRCGS